MILKLTLDSIIDDHDNFRAPAPEEVRTIEAEQRWSRPQVAPVRVPEIDRSNWR